MGKNSKYSKENLTEHLRILAGYKKDKKTLTDALKDELRQNPSWVKADEEYVEARNKRKAIQEEVMEESGHKDGLDDVKANIKAEEAIVSEIALQLILSDDMKVGEELESRDFHFFPNISVKYKSQQLKMNI